MLAPGQVIRPPIHTMGALRIAKIIYGLGEVDEVEEMDSYDDRNFRLQVDGGHYLTLKVINALDSRNSQLQDAITEVQALLRRRGLNVPRLVRTGKGPLWGIIEKFGPEPYAYRLQLYLPGVPLGQVPFTTKLLVSWGRLLRLFHCKLEGYRNPFLERREHIWKLSSVPKLSEFLQTAVPQPERRAMVERVMADFERNVLPCLPDLEHGVLHGDLNENNVLVENSQVSGLLDLGDIYWGPRVFDVAVMLTYALLKPGDPDPLSRAGPCLYGYLDKGPMSGLELQLIKPCVAARLCQSLVLGAYTAHLHPDNQEYVLLTAATGWTVLEKVLSLPESSSWPFDPDLADSISQDPEIMESSQDPGIIDSSQDPGPIDSFSQDSDITDDFSQNSDNN